MQIDFPYHFDDRHRTATEDYAGHVRNLIEQILFTNPGERINRPEFGGGALRLVFAPNSPELAATVELVVNSALQRWLSDVISVEALSVTSDDAELRIQIDYVILRTQDRVSENFVFIGSMP